MTEQDKPPRRGPRRGGRHALHVTHREGTRPEELDVLQYERVEIRVPASEHPRGKRPVLLRWGCSDNFCPWTRPASTAKMVAYGEFGRHVIVDHNVFEDTRQELIGVWEVGLPQTTGNLSDDTEPKE